MLVIKWESHISLTNNILSLLSDTFWGSEWRPNFRVITPQSLLCLQSFHAEKLTAILLPFEKKKSKLFNILETIRWLNHTPYLHFWDSTLLRQRTSDFDAESQVLEMCYLNRYSTSSALWLRITADFLKNRHIFIVFFLVSTTIMTLPHHDTVTSWQLISWHHEIMTLWYLDIK